MAEEKKTPAAGEQKKTNGRTPSAVKRAKQSEKARLSNQSFKAGVKTAIRSFETSLSKGDKSGAKENLKTVYSLMDKGVKTGRFKSNKAARTKARLADKAAV
jgi:small subunit ribosomal protein S20